MTKTLRTILLISVILLCCGLWQPYDINSISLDNRHAPPGFDSLMGTDHLGRDVLSRIMAGAGHTLVVLITVGITSCGLGIVLGTLAGLTKGLTTRLIIQLADFVIIMPTLVFALCFTALFGLTPLNAGIALGFASFGPYTILSYNLTRRVMKQPYIEAAKIYGAGPWQLLIREVFQNIKPTILTFLAGDVARNVLNYSALAFLGLGADTSRPDWGAMIFEYRIFMFENPWLIFWPCLAIFSTTLALNLQLDPNHTDISDTSNI